MQLVGTEQADRIRDYMHHWGLIVPDLRLLFNHEFETFDLPLSRIGDLTDDVRRDPGDGKGLPNVEKFLGLIQAGRRLPPVLVLDDWLFDGKHRICAHRLNGDMKVEAIDIAGLARMPVGFYWRLRPE